VLPLDQLPSPHPKASVSHHGLVAPGATGLFELPAAASFLLSLDEQACRAV
jgi:hypothetical protein